MRNPTRMRLSLMLLVLALVIVLTGYANRKAEAYCLSIGSCETCQSLYESCMAGTIKPECGGQDACCSSKFVHCWECCIWP